MGAQCCLHCIKVNIKTELLVRAVQGNGEDYVLLSEFFIDCLKYT